MQTITETSISCSESVDWVSAFNVAIAPNAIKFSFIIPAKITIGNEIQFLNVTLSKLFFSFEFYFFCSNQMSVPYIQQIWIRVGNKIEHVVHKTTTTEETPYVTNDSSRYLVVTRYRLYDVHTVQQYFVSRNILCVYWNKIVLSIVHKTFATHTCISFQFNFNLT